MPKAEQSPDLNNPIPNAVALTNTSEEHSLYTEKKYQIIYADPPWEYKDKNKSGNRELKYPTMKLSDIKNMDIQSITDDNCILFLWVTFPHLQSGLDVINSWGFKYKTIGFNWIKLNKVSKTPFIGLGHYTRANSEICLIATKGKIKIINKSISSVIMSEIEEHSKKPDIVREHIVSLLGDLPRVELFARTQTEGWDVFGNEVENSIIIDIIPKA